MRRPLIFLSFIGLGMSVFSGESSSESDGPTLAEVLLFTLPHRNALDRRFSWRGEGPIGSRVFAMKVHSMDDDVWLATESDLT